MEKNNKSLQGQLSQLNKRLTEAGLELNDLDVGNRKTVAENADLLRQLEELDGRHESLV